jgi:MFS family permease
MVMPTRARTVDKPVASWWPWLLLAMLWCVVTLNYLDRQVIFSIFPLLQRDLHATSLQLGLTSTLFLLTYGIASPFAGYAADRFGHRKIILLSLVIWSASSLLAGTAHSMHAMLWTRVAMGLSEAFYIPAALGLLMQVHEYRFQSLAAGIHQSGCYAGIILGGTLGGLAATHYSWRSLFLTLGVSGVLYSGVLWLAFRKRVTSSVGVTHQDVDFTGMLKTASLSVYTIVFVVFSIATWMLYTWLPLYLYEHFHMSLLEAGFKATFWIQVASFGGAFLGGAISDALGGRYRSARLLVQALGLGIICPFLILLSHTNSQIVVTLALISIGLGRGCFDANTAPIMAQLVGPQRTSSAYGILNCVGCVVAGVTTLLGGWMRQHASFSIIFAAAGLTLLCGIACLLVLARRESAAVAA